MASKQTSKNTSRLTIKSIWFGQYHVFHPSGWTKCALGMKQHPAIHCPSIHNLLCRVQERQKGTVTHYAWNAFCLPVRSIPNQCKSLVKGKFCSAGAKLCISEPSTNAKSWSEIMLVNEAEPASSSSSSFELRFIPWSAHWTPTAGSGMPRRRSEKCNIITVMF